MKHPYYKLIENFYTAFQNNDPEGMANCYHENIVFEDPAFGQLKGKDAKDMWRMLISRSKGQIEIIFKDITAEQYHGSAYWEAKYHFSKTGRSVHNKINASFEFEDGRIIKHTDSFNFHKWSFMALGLPGLLLGFTPIIKNKVRKESLRLLKAYQAKSG